MTKKRGYNPDPDTNPHEIKRNHRKRVNIDFTYNEPNPAICQIKGNIIRLNTNLPVFGMVGSWSVEPVEYQVTGSSC